MIEKDWASPPARPTQGHRPASAREADPAAAKRFGDLVRPEPKPREAPPKASTARQAARDSDTGEAAGTLAAQIALPGALLRLAAESDGGEQRGGSEGSFTADPPTPPTPASDVSAKAVLQQGAALPEQSFTAMLDRVHLQQGAQSQTQLTMSDAAWLAREATITRSDSGALSLSLSMNMGNGSGEALEELRRRLEARGLAVERIADSGPF